MTMFIDMKATIKFASSEIKKFINQTEKKVLQKQGAAWRGRAMKEIKPAPLGQAAPKGEAFHSHPTKGKGDSGIKKLIQYAYDPANSGVVIGPVAAQDLFARHEHGEKVVNKRRRKRKIGDMGIMVRGRTGKQNRYVFNPVDRKFDGSGIREPVTIARIHNEKQLARVNRLEEEIYGPATGDAVYPKRPVMENAVLNNPDAVEEGLRLAYGDEGTSYIFIPK